MEENLHELPQDLEMIVRELDRYTREKFHAVKFRRERRQIAKHLDGEYDICRLLEAQRENRVNQDAPYERQVSAYLEEQIGCPPNPGFAYIPCGRRALTTDGSPGTGPELVGVDLQASQFISYYDSFLPLNKLGVQRFFFQRASSIPGISANITTYWLDGDGAAVTESTVGFLQRASSPKTIGALAEVTNQWIRQTHPSVQARVWQAIAEAAAKSVTRALIGGTGLNGQPAGIYSTPGVGTVAGGSWNYGKILDLIEGVESSNALLTAPSGHFIMTPAVARWSRERNKFPGTDSQLLMDGNAMAGHGAIVTSGASENSVCFGDFSSLALCEFSRLQVAADPYGVSGSTAFAAGLVTVRVLWDIDFIFLNPAAFSCTGLLT